MKKFESTAKLEIKPYSQKELAAIYDISSRSFSTWLKPFAGEIGQKYGKYYNVHQVNTIVGRLGVPYLLEI